MVSFLLAVALIIGIFFIVLALHILILPVRISGRLRSDRSDLFLAGLKWGLIRVSVLVSAGGATLYLFSFRLKEFDLGDGSDSPEDEKKSKMSFDAGKIKPLLDEIALIIRAISIDYFRLNARVGLGDPAWTGILFGLVSALKGLLSCSDRIELNVLPVFETEALDCEIEAVFRIDKLFRIIMPAIRIIRITGGRKEIKKPESFGSVSAV